MSAKRDLKVQTPGEDPAVPSDAVDEPAAEAAPKPPAAGLPDQADVDHDAIPYGKSVLSRQGHVCSTAPDPKRK